MVETKDKDKTDGNAEDEAKVKEHGIFLIDGVLQDAWGRPADSDEAVDFFEENYDGQTVEALKAELKRREGLGREFDKKSIKTKKDLVNALVEDDRAVREEAEEEAPDQPDDDEDNEE